MEREGKTLNKLAKGDKRRVADMKNGWRKASFAQRVEILDWIAEGAIDEDTADGVAREWIEPPKS